MGIAIYRTKPDPLDFRSCFKYLTKNLEGKIVSPIFWNYEWKLGEWHKPTSEVLTWTDVDEYGHYGEILNGGVLWTYPLFKALASAADREYIGRFETRGFVAGGLYESAWKELKLVELARVYRDENYDLIPGQLPKSFDLCGIDNSEMILKQRRRRGRFFKKSGPKPSGRGRGRPRKVTS